MKQSSSMNTKDEQSTTQGPTETLTPLQEKLLKIRAGQKLNLKELKRLTMPLFSMAHTPMLIVMMLGEIKEAEFVVGLPGKKDSKPSVVHCVNLDTQDEGMLIVNAIIHSALSRDGQPLQGRIFKLTARDIREGKKYRDIDVVELRAE